MSVAPGPVRNISVTFDDTSLSFDPVTREMNVSVTISWLEPLEPNGANINYTVTLESMTDVRVLGPVPISQTELVTMVTVLPYECYMARVVAVTNGGEGDESVSELARSPEAGVCVCVCVCMHACDPLTYCTAVSYWLWVTRT